MEYRELPLPPSLDGQVAAIWTMRHKGAVSDWIEHVATPDGCVEAILRLAGRSAWLREQPVCFATGLGKQPIRFGFSGDAEFLAVKLWPWAWEALGGAPCPSFANDWIPLDESHALHRLLSCDANTLVDRLEASLAGRYDVIGTALLTVNSVAQLRARTDLEARALQRWFTRHIGMSPRDYLRVLRFRDTLRALPQDEVKLADVAAARGYADQAHMARDFRAMAGTAPRRVRKRAKGPFL